MDIAAHASTDASADEDRALLLRWIRAMMAGELIGFVPPAAAGAIAYAAGVPDWAMLPILAAAGSLEGVALAAAQSTVLDDALPAVPRRQWIAATAAAASLAWAIGMTPSALGTWTEDHAVIVIAGMAVAAPVLLNSIGVAQWLVLRRHAEGTGAWVPANAIGWLAGLPAVFIAMALVPDDAPVAVRAAAGVAGAVTMGAIVAAITGRTLVRIVRRNAGPGV